MLLSVVVDDWFLVLWSVEGGRARWRTRVSSIYGHWRTTSRRERLRLSARRLARVVVRLSGSGRLDLPRREHDGLKAVVVGLLAERRRLVGQRTGSSVLTSAQVKSQRPTRLTAKLTGLLTSQHQSNKSFASHVRLPGSSAKVPRLRALPGSAGERPGGRSSPRSSFLPCSILPARPDLSDTTTLAASTHSSAPSSVRTRSWLERAMIAERCPCRMSSADVPGVGW